MTLVGLTFAQFAAIVTGVAAVVVALYILRLRRRTVQVAFSKLWERILREKQTTTLFQKLRRIVSLLVQLAIVLLLALALGDPRALGSRRAARSIVVLLDGSASMQATDVPPTRFARAVDEGKRLARGLGAADRMLVAQMDAQVEPLSPMTGDTEVLVRSLSEARPTDETADFARGLRFAIDTLRGEPNPEIVVLSDGTLPADPRDGTGLVDPGRIPVRHVTFARRSRNVAITAFSVRRYPLDKSRYEIFVEIRNTGAADESVELSILGDGRLVDLQRLRVAAGEALRRFYPGSGADRRLEARVALATGERDDLPADDRAFALLPERRRARILAVGQPNLYLGAALLLDEYLEVTEVSAAAYPAEARHFDVTIFDNVTPAARPGGNYVYLNPTGPHAPFPIVGEVRTPYFERAETRHPLMRFLDLDDVNVASARKLRLGPGDRDVAGMRGVPLVAAAERAGGKVVALAFDERQSDLPLRVAWPLFVINAIDWMVSEDAEYLSSFRTGTLWRVPVGPTVTQATWTDPDGRRSDVPVVEGNVVHFGTRAGFHTVRTPAGETVVAANLASPAESQLLGAAPPTVAGRTLLAPAGFHGGLRREIWLYLLLAVLLVLGAEWFTYNRRITV